MTGFTSPPADRRAGPVDLAGHAGLVLDALGQVVRHGVVPVALAEPGVAHGDHVLARALRLVLVVQQVQVDADLRHLGVHVGPVGLLEDALARVAVGVEQLVDPLVPHTLHLVPGDAAIVRNVEHLADAAHGHVPGLGDRPPRHALVAELHYELRPYLPCHVVSPSVDRLHGKPILRAEEGRYGNGGTGDTEGAKRLDGKRYGKRETGATQSAQYSPPAARFSTARIRARAPPVRRLYDRDAIPVVERKEWIMARRIPAREVPRLRSSNLSLNAIAAALHASKASVSVVLRAAAEHDVAWEEAERMSAGEVYARLFPEREQPGPVYPDPDWDAVHAELAKVGVTLRLLHGEYREECAARGEAATSYDRFCKRYRQFTVSRNVVSWVGRKAGRNMEVDWSGPTMSLVDQASIWVTVLRLIP